MSRVAENETGNYFDDLLQFDVIIQAKTLNILFVLNLISLGFGVLVIKAKQIEDITLG